MAHVCEPAPGKRASRPALPWLAALLVFAGGPGVARAADADDRLEIVTASGVHRFRVELALDAASRARGLMNRRRLAANAGMLFRFDRTGPVTMWMKDTLVPLDMIFIGEDGRVARIHRNATPGSLALIGSGGPVRHVLEVNAGIADWIGLRTGDRVRHRVIAPP